MNSSHFPGSDPDSSIPITDVVASASPGTSPTAAGVAGYRVVSLEDLFPGCGNLMPVMYGAIVPCLAVFLLLTDAVIIAVFMKPHVRSHTTYILTLIALADMLNILCPTVIYIYYYTLGNYGRPVPYRMCWWTYLLGDVFHDMFNGVSLWLTVLLAYIRCRCLKAPFEARCLHHCRNIIFCVAGIVALVMCVHIPSLFILRFHAVPRYEPDTNTTVSVCGVGELEPGGHQRKVHLWVKLLLDSFIPAAFLVYLDINILVVLRKAKQSRLSLRSHASFRKPITLITSIDSKNKTYKTVCGNRDCSQNNEVSGANAIGVKNASDQQNYQNCDQLHMTSCTDANNGIARVPHSPMYVTIELTDDLAEYCCVATRTQTSNTRRNPRASRQSRGCCWSCLAEECSPPGRRKRGSRRSCDSAFDRLDRESRRTSWLILAVVTLITTHEIPYSLINVATLIRHYNSPLPMSKFGCWGPYLNLWQYIIYPLTFLIYACMSSVFRHEMTRVVRCQWRETEEHGEPRAKNVFMSPCSVRKTLSHGNETTIHDSEDEVCED